MPDLVRRAAGVAAGCTVLLAAACAGDPPDGSAGCERPTPADAARVLFDGTQESLDEWRMAGPGSFELTEDCALRTVGGMGLLWYPEEFAEYRLTLDWRVAGDDNSGVFVGFPEPGDDPWVAVEQGYEVQIDATDEPDRTTGAIYGVQGADVAARDAALNPPGEWNTYDIAVSGQVITVSLNGVVVTEYASTDPSRDLTSGHVGLQNHGADDEVHFRDVVLVPLD